MVDRSNGRGRVLGACVATLALVLGGLATAASAGISLPGWLDSPTNPSGYLRVVSSPAVPTQISVDGHISDTWGLTWVKQSVGAHQVCFGDVAGYTTPNCELITVTEASTTTVTGAFARRGFLKVSTSPAVASRISIDGIGRDNWGVYTDLPTGSHTVCFGPVAGFAPPPCQDAVVSAGGTTDVTGTFTASPSAVGQTGVGFLRVTTSPAVPSQISVDGTPSDTWGLNWLEVEPGTHVVCYARVEGYSTPACDVIDVVPGTTTTTQGSFVARGFLKVVTSPALPGTITIDGFPANDWGVFTDVPPGTYHVCFGNVSGRTTPACQDPVVAAGATTTITANYG